MRVTLTAAAALMIALTPAAAQTTESAPIAFVERQTDAEMLGTDFINTPVTTKDGQKIGTISNLVFDQTGRIELAVIGVGGFLGVGSKDVAVPFDSVKLAIVGNQHVFVIDATKETLKAAPTYHTLSRQALDKRIQDWRAKAQASWADAKSRATKAYDEAKQRVEQAKGRLEEARKPAQ
jgi:sporulation protein YlmC with PRC-barrel domain